MATSKSVHLKKFSTTEIRATESLVAIQAICHWAKEAHWKVAIRLWINQFGWNLLKFAGGLIAIKCDVLSCMNLTDSNSSIFRPSSEVSFIPICYSKDVERIKTKN